MIIHEKESIAQIVCRESSHECFANLLSRHLGLGILLHRLEDQFHAEMIAARHDHINEVNMLRIQNSSATINSLNLTEKTSQQGMKFFASPQTILLF